MKVLHSTSKENLRKIRRSKYLRGGSYVTTVPSVKNMSSERRADVLCLDDKSKGKCFCECETERAKLRIPLEGDLTCHDYPQYQLKENLPIEKCLCECEIPDYSLILVSAGIVSAVLLLFLIFLTHCP
ncbi:MAG: hypothetical protein AB1485_06565 [Candidatus Thermoplasmatota archaeon]